MNHPVCFNIYQRAKKCNPSGAFIFYRISQMLCKQIHQVKYYHEPLSNYFFFLLDLDIVEFFLSFINFNYSQHINDILERGVDGWYIIIMLQNWKIKMKIKCFSTTFADLNVKLSKRLVYETLVFWKSFSRNFTNFRFMKLQERFQIMKVMF